MFLLLIGYTILGLIVTLCILVYVKLVRFQKYLYDIYRAQGIPGKPFTPVFGQIFDIIRANKEDKGIEYINELSQKFGSCFLLGLGPFTRLVLLEPELIADVLGRSKVDNYQKPLELSNIVKSFIGVHNLLVSEGQEHERARKMLNPAFHFVNLRSMVSIMSDETAKTIDSLLSSFSSTNEKLRMDVEVNALTLSIIASSAFGQNVDTVSNGQESIAQIFNEVKDVVGYRTIRLINQIKFLDALPFWGKQIIENGSKMLNELVDQTIANRRSGKSMSLCSGQDILDLLLSATDENGEPFSDQQIKDEALTFVLAGHETTGNLMTWALYILMTHENVLQACREEVDRVLPNGTIPTFEHMADLQVIEAVIYETLRLYPPAPLFARECIKEHTIGGTNNKREIHIPVGSTIVIHVYSIHRREEYWPHPLEFDYNRWIRDPVTGLKPKLVHPYAYLPFAAGSRNCIGQNFALLEAKVMLAMFVQRCEFKLEPGQIIVPESKGVTMTPKYGMFATVKRRNCMN